LQLGPAGLAEAKAMTKAMSMGTFPPILPQGLQGGGIVSAEAKVAVLNEESFDAALIEMEKAADLVDDAAKGSVMKNCSEQNLLKIVEKMRDGMGEAVIDPGERLALSRVFAHNGCERICKLRLVLDTVQIEVYSKDDRWLDLRKMCSTIESVLNCSGTARLWRAKEGNANAEMIKRQLVWESKKQNGDVHAPVKLQLEDDARTTSPSSEVSRDMQWSNLSNVLDRISPSDRGASVTRQHQTWVDVDDDASLRARPLHSAGKSTLAEVLRSQAHSQMSAARSRDEHSAAKKKQEADDVSEGDDVQDMEVQPDGGKSDRVPTGHFDMSEGSDADPWVPIHEYMREQKRRKLAEDKFALVLRLASMDAFISDQAQAVASATDIQIEDMKHCLLTESN
jgi:hypothetical protein